MNRILSFQIFLSSNRQDEILSNSLQKVLFLDIQKQKMISRLESDDSNKAMFCWVVHFTRQHWCRLPTSAGLWYIAVVGEGMEGWSGWEGYNRYHLLAAIPTLQYTINGAFGPRNSIQTTFVNWCGQLRCNIDTERGFIELLSWTVFEAWLWLGKGGNISLCFTVCFIKLYL